jgi:uncharacterized protein (TIGR04222 family)
VRRALLAVLTALLLAPAGVALAQDDTGWTIESFDATVAVRDDGALHVEEVIAVDFASLERRGIFRVIPAAYPVDPADPQVQLPEGRSPDEFRRMIRIEDVAVSSTAPDDIEITGGEQVTIRIGDEDITVTGRQEYRISYTVVGALRQYPDGIQVSWNASGLDWPVAIERATAVVQAPSITAAACSRGRFGASRPCEEATTGDGQARFATGTLDPGEGLTVDVTLAPGTVAVPPPIIEERWDLGRALTGSPAAVPLAGLLGLLGLGGVGLLAYRQGRDRVTRGGVTVDGHLDEQERRQLFSPRSTPVQFRPPGDLRPAQLGVLIDEKVDPVEISATLVDLAVRGHLLIEEIEQGRFRRRRDWRLTRRRSDKPDELAPFEAHLLSTLFAEDTTVVISETKGTYAKAYGEVRDKLYADAVAQGWFPRNPQTTRYLWLGIGIAVTVLAAGAFALALAFTTIALAFVPLIVAGLAMTVAHNWMPHRTPKGSRMLDETLGFREFIATAEQGRMEFAEEEHLFERYLPYAVVFGVVDKWANAFSGLGDAATAGLATWYIGSSGLSDIHSLSGGLSEFSHDVGSSLSTTPSGSGSGSGGGFSGGGFGGGGGGSW